MDKFEVGEIAIGQNFINSTLLNGTEMEIIGKLDKYPISTLNGFPCDLYILYGYRVRKPGGAISCIDPQNLRKKKPPEELSTWEEIEEEFNWNPKKVNHNV